MDGTQDRSASETSRADRHCLDAGSAGRDTEAEGRRHHDRRGVDPNGKAVHLRRTCACSAAEVNDNVHPCEQVPCSRSRLSDSLDLVLAVLDIDVALVPHVVTHTTIVAVATSRRAD